MIRALVFLLALTSVHWIVAQEWTRFRGPNGQGIAPDIAILSAWTEADYNWKTPLPGSGHSSPVLWSDRVFVGSADETSSEVLLLCVNARDGKLLWKSAFPLERFRKHNYNTFASGTPAVDRERVYFCYATPDRFTAVAIDHSGVKKWERNLGPYASQHGPGCSPIIFRDLVVIAVEQDRESFLIALDTASGETRWKTPRKTVEAAYATPCVFEPQGGKPMLIFNSEAHGVCAIDPSTGTSAWEYRSAFDKRVVSSPVIAGDVILGSCGSGGGGNYVIAIRPPTGAKTQPEAAWTIRRSASYVPTSVAFRDRVYLWSDGGIVTCADPVTGEVKYQERVGGNFFSSPIIVGDRLIGVSTRGEIAVLATGDSFKVLGRSALGETIHSTPAVANGSIYFRTIAHLISVGGKTPNS